MKVRDKNVKQMVDVADKECPKRECYWPRPDPGIFTQGVGYRTRYPGRKPDWLCGNREIRGCPAKYCHTSNPTGLRCAGLDAHKQDPIVGLPN